MWTQRTDARGSLHDVSVGGGALAGLGAAAQFGQDGAVVGRERLGAFCVRPHGEQGLLEVLVSRHGGGEQIGDGRIEREGDVGRAGVEQVQCLKVQCQAFLAS